MKNRKLLVTMKDIHRYKILKDVIEKKLKGVEAAELLKLHPVHISRLKKELIKGGFEALLRKPPKEPPNQKVANSVIKNILCLRKKIYYDFNILHFMEKLDSVHKIRYSYETIRQILIKNNEHAPKRKKKIHRQRRRMPKAGLLEQMDSSEHNWIASIKDKWHLVAIIDDATNEVPYAKFFPKDTTYANMHVIRRAVEIKGVFVSLYADKASHFKTTRHGGLHYITPEEQGDTQIERALEELDINLIPANSPQAKGRIEVTFRLFQDRLIKEMRIAGIKDYKAANKFLIEKFLPWYNSRFTHEAESAFMPLPKDKNLDLIFCIKEKRTVNNDNTVQFKNQIIQILPSKIKRTFAKSRVSVCLLEDSRIFVLYKNQVIAESRLSKNSKVLKKEKKVENIMGERKYAFILKKLNSKKAHKPSNNNIWTRFARAGMLEKQYGKT